MGELYNPFPKLPKNIRQIGESDQVLRFYMEDYVNTYLKRLYPAGKQTMRVGLLLGNVEQYDGTPYIFVDGAMEMEDVETDGEKILFSERSWKQAYQRMEEEFPKRTIQGWFLCGGPGSQLSPLNYWKQHGQYFAGKNQLMYLNHGLEGEEAIYITSEDGFYRLKGHCIYYERNQMMQDYMITRKDVRRVESGSCETVIKDFHSRMQAKKEQASMYSRTVSAMGILCGVLSVAVLAGGVVLVNNYSKMQQMESVLASVLPAGVTNWGDSSEAGTEAGKEASEFVIEELPGHVYPTKTAGETGEHTGTAMADAEDAGMSGTETSGVFGAEAAAPGIAGAESTAWEESAGAADGASVGMAEGASADVPAAENADAASADVSAAENIGSEPTAEAQAESLPEPEGTAPDRVGMRKEGGQGDASVSERLPIDYEAAAANGYRVYEIGEGETLYGICLKVYGNLRRLDEVCRLNDLDNVDKILAGQKLVLP